MSKKHNGIKGIIIDLDKIIKHVIDSSLDFEKHNSNLNFTFIQFDKVLYPSDLSKSFWSFSEVIKKIGNFLNSILSCNLSIGILSRGNTYFLSTLINFWGNIDKSDFTLISCAENISKHNTFNQNIILMIKNINIPVNNLMIIGETPFYFESNLSNNILKLRFIDSQYDKNSKYHFVSKNLTDALKTIKKNILFDKGKLPNNFLNELLSKYKFKDDSIIIGPSVGEDTAAIDITKDEILLLKSDPVTFVTNSIGYYSVLINSNDMATAGAMPRWMLTTLMFPPYTSAYAIEKIFSELHKTCSNFGIFICGGHTEITDAVSRPIVASTVVGTIEHKNFINKQGIKSGDLILMTKGIAIEGTVIIASEFKKLLSDKGMSEEEIKECLKLKSKISILDEAKIAWKNPGVSALHDVTEGGLSTAINELSKTSGHNINIYINDILIYRQTQDICDLLSINALGLIGSGSLLICCKEKTVDSLINDMKKKNIPIRIIGKVFKKGSNLEAYNRNGTLCKMPQFEVDEIAKITRLVD